MAPQRFRHIGLNQLKGLAFFFALILLMEAVTRLKLVSPLYLPPVSQIFGSFLDLVWNGPLLKESGFTVLRAVGGFVAAAIIMVPFGLFVGTCERCLLAVDPTLELLRPIPPPVIIPVAILLLGINEGMRMLVVSLACAFPIVTNTIKGARNVHPLLIHSGRCLGLNRRQMLRMIVLPGSLPQVFAGFRITLPIALIVTILAEMVGGHNGVGYWILRMQRSFSIPEMYAGVVMLGIMGYSLNQLLELTSGHVLSWYDGWVQSAR